VWNIFRAHDDRRTDPASPQVEATEWTTCNRKSLGNLPVTLAASGVTLAGRTGLDGTATIDVTPIASASGDPNSANVQVQLPRGPLTTTIALTTAPAYTAWRQARAANAAAASKSVWQAAQQEDQQQRTASLAHIDTVLTELEQTKAPWVQGDVDRFTDIGRTLKELLQTQSAVDQNLQQSSQRWSRLTPVAERSAQLIKEAADAAEAAAAHARVVRWQTDRKPHCFDPCYAQCVAIPGMSSDDCHRNCFDKCQ
jgi:hypothetical protein